MDLAVLFSNKKATGVVLAPIRNIALLYIVLVLPSDKGFGLSWDSDYLQSIPKT